MALEQDILKYLEDNGLFANEAKESLAILKAKPTSQAIRWTEEASQYPKSTVVAIRMQARLAAVEWIDKNAPRHWARGIFDDKRAGVPHYWATETSGVLQPAVEAYLRDQAMTPEQIVAMRSYLQQWIENGNWIGGSIGDLRAMARRIKTQADIHEWIYRAELEGIDPL